MNTHTPPPQPVTDPTRPSPSRPTAPATGEPAPLDHLIGAGADLWASDEELDDFLAGIHARRKDD